jgi:hypothetical protein
MTGRSAIALSVLFLSALPSASYAADCSNAFTGKTPLNDLGTGTYNGYQGGLYPGGSNLRPLSHDRALDRTSRMMLLDAAGNPDAVSGVFVLISIGNSNATQEFRSFKPVAEADPDANSRLVLVDCAQAGQGADILSDPTAEYWSHVDDDLAAAGVTNLQVQSVWMKIALPYPSEGWPLHAEIYRDDLRTIAQILKSRFPNLRSIHHSSRIYAGYGPDSINPEPYAYEYGFSVKWLLEEQLSGSAALNFDAAKGPVLAPWMSWGPYLWADGLHPRSDGLVWECRDFDPDGAHPSFFGKVKVTNMLLDHFKNDPTTKPWFVDCDLAEPDTFAPPPEVLGDRIRKLSGSSVELSWDSLDPVVGRAAVYDVVRGTLSELRADLGFARASCLAVGILDTPYVDSTGAPPPGDGSYYLVRGRDSCAEGSFGDGSAAPDPRDALDSGVPACP